MAKQLPQMDEVSSSNISHVGYNPDTQELFIKFISGHLWKYSPVTEMGYASFRAADSLGKYFFNHIKTNVTLTATKIY